MNGREISVFKKSVIFCLVSGLLLAAGCGGTEKKEGGKKTGEKKAGIKLEAVPESFDDGRLTLSVPKNWGLMPRSQKFAARFSYKKNYPQLNISAEEMPDDETELTATYVKTSIAKLEKSGAVKAAKYGKYEGFTYQKQTRGSSYDFMSVFFVTLQSGRLYTFQMQEIKQEFSEKSVERLEAVVASAKFGEPKDTHTAEEGDEPGGLTFGEGGDGEEDTMPTFDSSAADFGGGEETPEE